MKRSLGTCRWIGTTIEGSMKFNNIEIFVDRCRVSRIRIDCVEYATILDSRIVSRGRDFSLRQTD